MFENDRYMTQHRPTGTSHLKMRRKSTKTNLFPYNLRAKSITTAPTTITRDFASMSSTEGFNVRPTVADYFKKTSASRESNSRPSKSKTELKQMPYGLAMGQRPPFSREGASHKI